MLISIAMQWVACNGIVLHIATWVDIYVYQRHISIRECVANYKPKHNRGSSGHYPSIPQVKQPCSGKVSKPQNHLRTTWGQQNETLLMTCKILERSITTVL